MLEGLAPVIDADTRLVILGSFPAAAAGRCAQRRRVRALAPPHRAAGRRRARAALDQPGQRLLELRTQAGGLARRLLALRSGAPDRDRDRAPMKSPRPAMEPATMS